MGIINLPAFESNAVEQRVAPQENPAYAGLAALQQAKRRFFGTLFDTAVSVGQKVIDTALTNQYNKAIMDYSEAQQQKLLELEKNPVTSVDPRFNDMSPEEQINPNLTEFNKWKQNYLGENLEKIGLPAARRRFEKWAREKGLAETEGLAKFDIATTRATGRVQLADNLQKAVESGDRATVLDLINAATGPVISEAEAIEAKNTNFADISSREIYLQTLTKPTVSVPEETRAVVAPSDQRGMIGGGNIDLNSRPRDTGGNATTIEVDNTKVGVVGATPVVGEKQTVQVLIPMSSPDGKPLSREQAIAQYQQTGQNFGTFADAEAASRYSKSLADAMAQSYTPAQASGLEFLADRNNLRYTNWDGKTATLSLGEQENLVAKYKVHLQEVAKQRDTFYSDVHIRADSLEKVDQAISMLRDDRSLTGTQKYEWEKRFDDDRNYYLGLLNLKNKAATDAHDDWMKANEDLMRGELAVFHSQHPDDVQGLQDILYRAFNRADRRVSGKFVEEMLGKYEHEDTGEYKLAVGKMEKAVAKLPPAQQFTLMSGFERWYRDPANKVAPSDKEVQQAIDNLMSGYLLKAVDSAFPAFVQRYQTGGFTGIVDVNMKALEAEVPLAVKWAQKFWPDRKVNYGFIDKTNEYGFGEGAAILMDGTGHAYAFKMEGKELKLYAYMQTDPTGAARTGKGQAQGDYVWQEVSRGPKGGVTPGQLSIEAAGQREAQAQGWQAAIAEGRTQEQFAASGVSQLNITQMQQLVDAINVPWLGVNLLPKIAAELSASFGTTITAADLEYEAKARGYLK